MTWAVIISQPSNCDATPGTISARTLRGAYGPTDSVSQLRSDVRPERRAGPAVRRPDDHLHALPETVPGHADGRRRGGDAASDAAHRPTAPRTPADAGRSAAD